MIGIEYYILNPLRLNKRKKLDWFELWVNKSDYIMNFYKTIRGKYKIIDESIDYYIVMLEMGIYYLKVCSEYSDYVYQQYNIIVDDEMIFKEDFKERDFAEYLKYLFYKGCDINYVYSLIDNEKYKFNYCLVFCRLLFPSHYFYYFEKVISDNKCYDELQKIVVLSKEYEDYLRILVDRMNKYLVKKIILPF